MKLNEITSKKFTRLTDPVEIHEWMERALFDESDYFIHSDGTVDVDGSADISDHRAQTGYDLQVKFGKVTGKFECDGNRPCPPLSDFAPTHCKFFSARDCELTSAVGTPEAETVILVRNDITSFEGLPPVAMSELNMSRNPIISLIGISDHIKKMHGKGSIALSFRDIKEGGLGLLLIKGLKTIMNTDGAQVIFKCEGPWKIIKDYLLAGKQDQIFECQNELIEAGFDDYAQL